MIRRVVAIVAAFLGSFALTAPMYAQPLPPARTLVVPFDNLRRDASIFWVGEASAVLLTDALNALGAPAITREQRRAAFEQLQVPPTATLTDATVIRIAQLAGAAEVITGSVELQNGTLAVRARVIALETGRVRRQIREDGQASDIFATFDRLARQIAGSRASSAADPMYPPLAAFENYIKGLLAVTAPTAIGYLDAALREHPGFDRARLALWNVYADQGDHAGALAAVTPVAEDSPYWLRARFRSGLSYLSLRRYDDAFAAFETLVDAGPSPTALNNLGVVQIRRGVGPQTDMPAASYFSRAAKLDGNDPDYFFNLGYAFWQARDYQASIYWLREAVRRSPADGDAHFVLAAALAAGGSPLEAGRERDLARRLSSTYEQWEKRPAGEVVPKGLERVKAAVELPHRSIEALTDNGQRDQQALAQFYLERGRRLFQMEQDRQALDDLNRAIFLSPYEAEAHLLVGRIHLRNNRAREAIDAFKISLWSEETPAAHLALADAYLQMKDADAARSEADRALALDPSSADARRLLARIGSR